jgi:hypothetical protein
MPTPRLTEPLLEETRAYAGELEALAVLADEVQHWTRELKQIDETLELVWAPESVEHPALVPGRFHIIERRPMPTPPNVIPLVGEDNEFREPGSWMFEMLRRNDHWSNRSQKIREEKAEQAAAARDRAAKREHEERSTEIDERIKALLNPGVSMHKSAGRGWSYRASSRRAR